MTTVSAASVPRSMARITTPVVVCVCMCVYVKMCFLCLEGRGLFVPYNQRWDPDQTYTRAHARTDLLLEVPVQREPQKVLERLAADLSVGNFFDVQVHLCTFVCRFVFFGVWFGVVLWVCGLFGAKHTCTNTRTHARTSPCSSLRARLPKRRRQYTPAYMAALCRSPPVCFGSLFVCLFVRVCVHAVSVVIVVVVVVVVVDRAATRSSGAAQRPDIANPTHVPAVDVPSGASAVVARERKMGAYTDETLDLFLLDCGLCFVVCVVGGGAACMDGWMDGVTTATLVHTYRQTRPQKQRKQNRTP